MQSASFADAASSRSPACAPAAGSPMTFSPATEPRSEGPYKSTPSVSNPAVVHVLTPTLIVMSSCAASVSSVVFDVTEYRISSEPLFVTVAPPTDSSPGAISENDTTALAGAAEMSTVPAVKVLAPTAWVSVNIAPVTPTTAVVIDALKKRASPSRRGRL